MSEAVLATHAPGIAGFSERSSADLVPKASKDMTTIGRKWKAAALGLVVASGAWFDTKASVQAVAYTPQVSSILNGGALQATPVVSADRRVRPDDAQPVFQHG